MSTTETPTPAKKPVKKKAKPKAAKPDVAFAGLTESECAAGCNVNRCVISGQSYCGHPLKGGLTDGSPGALGRLLQARKQLKLKDVEKHFG